ncbi:MAG: hypothetical protein EA381_06830 [Planctomycetaceae bacterium]|nr:MAG: hypothetical protein EA381_06830 [Planctomycetaceae bacterium]
MSEILLHYKRPDPTTWVYLSSFLTIGLFFVFHRFWSMRNLDLVLLILLAPGLLIVHEGRRRQLVEREQIRAQEWLESQAQDAGSIAAVNGGVEGLGALPGSGEAAEPLGDPLTTAVSDTLTGLNQPADSAVETLADGDEVSDAGVLFTPREVERYGFVWLLSIQVLILVRLLIDPLMVRRPLLDPNLTSGGLLFIGVWLFIFMMANVITSTPRLQVEQGPQLGPGYSLMNMLPAIPTRPNLVLTRPDGSTVILPDVEMNGDSPENGVVRLARVLAIASHLAIVVGIISIGYRHFGNFRAGIGSATLYLMLPYTAQMTGRVDHALPAALLVWAVLCYRRPVLAGLFLGAAAGLVYYPLFLLPLWISFYRLCGVWRFVAGVVVSLLVMMCLLVIDGSLPLSNHLMRMFGLMAPLMRDLKGVWGLGWEPIYRLPLLVFFLILSGFFALWPVQKNLGTLIAYSAALMVAAQFWHAYGGGLYLAWFLPLLLLTVFRPNLEDRVAPRMVEGGRANFTRRPRVAAAN